MERPHTARHTLNLRWMLSLLLTAVLLGCASQSVGPGGVHQSAPGAEQRVGPGGVEQRAGGSEQRVRPGCVEQRSHGVSQQVGVCDRTPASSSASQSAAGHPQPAPHACKLQCGERLVATGCASTEFAVCQCQPTPVAYCRPRN